MRSAALSPLGIQKSSFANAYKEQQAETARRKQLLKEALKEPEKKSPLVKSMRVITRGDYSSIATQKLAGRALEKIAEYFGTTKAVISPHIASAMALYRTGEIEVDGGEVQNEARKEGQEDGEAVEKQVSDALETASQALVAFQTATGLGKEVEASIDIEA